LESSITSNQGLCSIEIRPDGIAFAHIPSANFEVTACEFYPYQFGNQLNNDQLKVQLSLITAKHQLKKIRCNWVLHPSNYRLTLINAPNVPQSEYKKAIRWQIKDIVNHPLEDTSVDIFYPDEPEKALKKVYVIAAQSSFLQNIAHVIQDCGLYPASVDIREFAIRNLITGLAKQDEVIGLLSIVDESCLMVSVKQSNIQFVRRFPINWQNLKADNYNDLITEMQRSFNYCQTELKQEIPIRFLMPPGIDKTMIQNVAKNLNKASKSSKLNVEVSIFNLQEIVTFKESIDPRIESHCWVAIGGALRNSIQGKQQ